MKSILIINPRLKKYIPLIIVIALLLGAATSYFSYKIGISAGSNKEWKTITNTENINEVDTYFKNGVYNSKLGHVEITDYKIVSESNTGISEEEPYIVFYYTVTNRLTRPISASTIWFKTMMTTQESSNGKEEFLESSIHFDQEIDESMKASSIKPNGTYKSFCAYTLNDTNKPVKIRGIFDGKAIGSQEFSLENKSEK